MSLPRLLVPCLLLALLFPVRAESQEEAAPLDEDVVQLPDVEISEKKDSADHITREQMEREGAADLWEAVRNVPGLVLSGGGARNDSSFKVRGFDSASMPVFVDGITAANPYRGDNDAARMLTGDYESITIEKGYSSMLLGSNTMGGAVIIKTARPKKPFEAMVSSGLDFDLLGKFAATTDVVSVGAKNDLFYGKGTFQYRGVDHYRIPYSFEPSKDNPQERGDRLWSDSNDIKATLVAGWTPFWNMDFSLIWVLQDSNKGFSPPDVNGKDFQIWEWPYYDRQSILFEGTWTPGPFTVKTLAYFQKFDNRMVDYASWANYLIGMHNPYSDYDDYTAGFRLEGGWDINTWNKLEAALSFKQDDHTGRTGEELTVHVNEDVWSLGAEYTMNPWKPLYLRGGIGFDAVVPHEFWGERNELMKELGLSSYIVQTNQWNLLAAEIGLFYDLTDNHELHLTYARKNHFPTMSQRYSTRYGESTPNPSLGPEYADHFEIGYRGTIAHMLRVNTALYYSNITGKIVEIRVPNPDYTAVTVGYTVNLDDTAMWGFELGGEWFPIPAFTLGGAFSWNRYSIVHSELGVETLPLYPPITANLYGIIMPIPALSIMPSIQYSSSRYIDTKGEAELAAYCLANLKITYTVNKYLSVSASVENIFDTCYEIKQYSPMPGRTYSFTITTQY